MVLRLRVPSPGNWERAKCAGQVRHDTDGDIMDPFFPEMPEDEQDALDFCNGAIDGRQCPIRDGCMLYALTNNERFGVWGGMSELAGRHAKEMAVARRKDCPVLSGNGIVRRRLA